MNEKVNEPLRLQVYLSRNGVSSRRKAMEIIQAGRVCVNGTVVSEPSFKVTAGKDAVTVSGKLVESARKQYLLLNKPKGYVTTRTNRYSEKIVMDLLPREYRQLHPVGRLDKDTEGLLLLTNDGDLTHHLTHPKYESPKTYEVLADGILSPVTVRKLENGVMLEERITAPAKIKRIKKEKDKTRFDITIHEGRKRQVRRMLDSVGHTVKELKRVAQGNLSLRGLRSGAYRHLTAREVKGLLEQKTGVKKGKTK